MRVRFAETDAQGIAHHASFVVWLEVARVAYLAEHAGGYRSIRARGIEALTTAVRVDYRAAAAFDDVLTIHLRCVDLRGARFRYEYQIERDGELDRLGGDAPRDRRRRDERPTRVPAWFAEAIARAEQESSPSARASSSPASSLPASSLPASSLRRRRRRQPVSSPSAPRPPSS